MRRVFAMIFQIFKINFLFFQLFFKCLNPIFKPVVKHFQTVVWENQSVSLFMCFLKSFKQLTVIFSIWRIRGTYTAWIIFLFGHEAEVEAFPILPPFPSCLTSCLYFFWFSDVSMSSFECVPHFFGRFAFWYAEKIIRIQCRSYYVLGNTIKLGHLTFFIGPLGPRFF